MLDVGDGRFCAAASSRGAAVAGLKVETVSKYFGGFAALSAVTIEVKNGEFLAVLGPSGCGKTTLLRLVAGFERLNEGTISMGERTVSAPDRHVPPEERHVGIVFQSYALWPHMTVAENVGYALRVAGVNRPEMRKRVEESLAVVGLTGFNDRRPSDLSGGQRQRVALARCLIQAPELVLLDEPLANLDVHLRASMENEFADFHRRTGSTMLYITHDQAEAMALADRIAVMNRGRIEQLAAPSDLYREPATEMVAQFIGQGILVPGEVRTAGREGWCMARVLGVDFKARCRPEQAAASSVKISLSPRTLRLAAADANGIRGRVRRAVYQGGFYKIEVSPETDPNILLVIQVPESSLPAEGDAVTVAIDEGWVIPGT
jgi:iron(III) transport system ATP-binding protein